MRTTKAIWPHGPDQGATKRVFHATRVTNGSAKIRRAQGLQLALGWPSAPIEVGFERMVPA